MLSLGCPQKETKEEKKKTSRGKEKLTEALMLHNLKLELRLKGEWVQVTEETRLVCSFIGM